jgi:type IV pilus assembly protein PilC
MNNAPFVREVRPRMLRFSARDQSVFAKRLAMILRSGVPVIDGLAMLETGNHSRSALYILKSLIHDVSHGQTLSGSLASFAHIFGAFTINIVRVGESSGTLHENLDYLSQELQKKDALKKKIVGALIYPALIVASTLGISLVLTLYIFPKIMPVFQSFKQDLPLSTKILISLSQFLLHNGILLLIGMLVCIVGVFFSLRMSRVRRALDRAILYVPLFGVLVRYYNLATFSRTMSLLLSADLGVVRALSVVSESTHHSLYRESFTHMVEQVSRGQTLSLMMHTDRALFPPLTVQMVAVGERTGNLSGSLMYLSTMYEEEIDQLTRNMTTLVEPVLMLLMGVVVGFVALSIITPIYGITQNLGPH